MALDNLRQQQVLDTPQQGVQEVLDRSQQGQAGVLAGVMDTQRQRRPVDLTPIFADMTGRVEGATGLRSRWGTVNQPIRALPTFGDIDGKMQTIMGAICSQESPYLRRQPARRGQEDEVYTLQLTTLEQDRTTLQGWETAYRDHHPVLAAFFAEMSKTLDEYARRVDLGQVQFRQQMEAGGAQPYIRDEGSRLVRFAVIIAAAAHFLIVGSMGLRRGELPTSALFSAAIMYLAFNGKNILKPETHNKFQTATALSASLRANFPELLDARGRRFYETLHNMRRDPDIQAYRRIRTDTTDPKQLKECTEREDRIMETLLGSNAQDQDAVGRKRLVDLIKNKNRFMSLLDTMQITQDEQIYALVLTETWDIRNRT